VAALIVGPRGCPLGLLSLAWRSHYLTELSDSPESVHYLQHPRGRSLKKLIKAGADFELVGQCTEGEIRLLNYLCDGEHEVEIDGEQIRVDGSPLDEIETLGLRSLYVSESSK